MSSNAEMHTAKHPLFNRLGYAGMRGAGIAGVLVAVLLSTFMAWPAQAQGATSATCSATMLIRISPGLTLVSRPGDITTGGETGSIVCVGTFNGDHVTGPGSFGVDGTLVGSCLADSGSGTYAATVPTDAGLKHFAGRFTESSIGPVGHVDASQPGAVFRGIETFVPTHGDCVIAPATEVVLNTTGLFQS